MKELGPIQKQAVETVGKNICVSAGAGTGKTRVLVERFLYLVQQKLAEPNEILAITFTERAAHEMKARIAKRLREQGLEGARRELENAYIGTIHAFAARLLREHPIEAGVDPGFQIIEEDDAHLLKEAVLDHLMEDRFQEPEVFRLLSIYSEKGLREAILSVVSQARTHGVPLSDVILRSALGTTKNPRQGDPSVPQDDVWRKNALNDLQPLKHLKGKVEDCADVEGVLGQPISDWKAFERAKAAGKQFRRHKARPEIGVFKDAFETWLACSAEVLGRDVRDTFLNLAIDFDARYQKRKRERSSLDFSDLEQAALTLLSSSEAKSKAVRRLYQKMFRFVLVDEFQDTAPIQDQLISLVSGADNQFLVGDSKQSIYGFRGADASLFDTKKEQFFQQASDSCFTLTESFRARGELINEMNPFFKSLWSEEGERFDALTPARAFPEKQGASVEFVTLEREPDESPAEVRMNEARVLAERIQALVSSGTYKYGDFAMLFGVATNIHFYEYELRSLGIPYYVVSGRGFYRQPEIRDLISMLELVENPHLDIPLASVLRSPLVQLSDDSLFWLANGSKRVQASVPLYDAFLNSDRIAEISEQDQARLRQFRTCFLTLLENKEKWSLSESLEFILSETHYDRVVLSLRQGKRHFANIRKLVSIAREVQARESAHLGDFIRTVKGLETQEVRESEAQVEALEGNVVKLMTIHKAKGLEFKAVVLPDLNRKGEKRLARFLFEPECGLGFKVWNEETRKFEDALTVRTIKERLASRALAESKRLLYVGMTRAQDHLILSGASKEEVEGESEGLGDRANWYEWVRDWVEKGQSGDRLGTGWGLSRDKLGTGQGLSPHSSHNSLVARKQIQTALHEGTLIETKVPREVTEVLKRLRPLVPTYFERIDLPVTAFATFDQSAELYRKTYELGVLKEENQKIEEWSADEDEDTLSPAEFGTVIHRIFEPLVLRPKQAEERLEKIVRRLSGPVDPATQQKITQLARQFLASKQFRDIRNAKVRYAEIPFALRLRGGLVQGTLDLLYQDAEGDWMIVDYKTNQVGPTELPKVAEEYRIQMMLYALACHELTGISIRKAVLYFARVDQTFEFSLEGADFGALRTQFESLQNEIIKCRYRFI